MARGVRGTSSKLDAQAILRGLQQVTGATMTQIVKNSGQLTLGAQNQHGEEHDEEEEEQEEEQCEATAKTDQVILKALHSQLFKIDPEKKGLLKKVPCQDAFETWDEEQGCKFSEAAEVDSNSWAVSVTAELRPFMKKEYHKRFSQEVRNKQKKAAPTEASPNVAVRKRPAAKQAATSKKPAGNEPGSAGAKATNAGSTDRGVIPESPKEEQPIQRPSGKAILMQRLAGMDEATLMALLSVTSQSQTLSLGPTTFSAPAGAGIPPTVSAKVEHEEVEHSDDENEDDSGSEKDADGQKTVTPMKRQPAKKRRLVMKTKGQSKSMKATAAMKAPKPALPAEPQQSETPQEADTKTLKDLESKTKNYIESKRLASGGVYYYDAGSCFKINWSKGPKIRGSLATKAKDKNDESAKEELHRKFHNRAAEIE
jgi:hypothetical protein